MDRSLAHFPRNPEYGLGVYRRRLHFVAGSRSMAAQVDDTHHSYWLTLEHDDVRVTDLDAGFIRAPNTACLGATGGLAALIGLPIEATISILARLPESSNCTHLSDLACWTPSPALSGTSGSGTPPPVLREINADVTRIGTKVDRDT